MRMRRGNRKQIARSLAPASDRSEKVTYSSCNRLILILLAFLLGTIGVLAVLWKTKSSPSHFDPANIAATATEGNIKKIDPIEKYNLRKADIVTAAPKEPKEGHLIIKTMHGDIAIVLLPELSAESVRYVRDMVSDLRQKGKVTCDRCTFHRAEKDLLLQGVLTTDDLPKNDVFGPCPDPHFTPSSNCPPHDPECGCHGPVMTRGMVAWAAGSAGGPDFFYQHVPPAGGMVGPSAHRLGRSSRRGVLCRAGQNLQTSRLQSWSIEYVERAYSF
uniref:PPIase cyclophilin-type domain-containing protein n=1 Tax=Corethron hystrix TaxID=216773 RepID=A0A7S1FX07_9STRA|mmetsp:Transcript_34423/g.79593  ORF Transcript_34423/g.79593 Transcript_34423/m.79593 type:complete len:273 (+) Transcript_34423:51-869(+)